MLDFENKLNKFQHKEAFECYGSLNDEKILLMQKDLGIQFSDSYIFFLKKYGYVEWFGHTILGYSDDEDYNTVSYTKELRNGDLPNDFVKIPDDGCVLESYGGGGHYFLFSQESSRKGQVVLFLDELFGKEAQAWESFEAFIDYMLSL